MLGYLISKVFGGPIGRLIALATVAVLVAVTTIYGLATPAEEIDTSSGPTTTSSDAATEAAKPAPVVVSGDVGSIGPKTQSIAEAPDGENVTGAAGDENVASVVAINPAPESAPVAQPAPAPPATIAKTAVLDFVLIDSRTGNRIRSLGTRPTISRRSFRNQISIEAITSPGTESVVFYLNGGSIRTERFAPYTLNGAYTWMERPGNYRLVANTYTGEAGTGDSGIAFQAQITIR